MSKSKIELTAKEHSDWFDYNHRYAFQQGFADGAKWVLKEAQKLRDGMNDNEGISNIELVGANYLLNKLRALFTEDHEQR